MEQKQLTKIDLSSIYKSKQFKQELREMKKDNSLTYAEKEKQDNNATIFQILLILLCIN